MDTEHTITEPARRLERFSGAGRRRKWSDEDKVGRILRGSYREARDDSARAVDSFTSRELDTQRVDTERTSGCF